MNVVIADALDKLNNQVVDLEHERLAVLSAPWIPVPWYRIWWLNIRYWVLGVVLVVGQIVTRQG